MGRARRRGHVHVADARPALRPGRLALNGEDSRVTMPLYVDDGRLYWDPTPAACEAVSADKLRLKNRFGIEFGEDDPASDYFLGANRQSSRRDGSKSSVSSHIDLMVKRYLPDADVSKFPAAWSYTPADESLTPLWESMSSNRPRRISRPQATLRLAVRRSASRHEVPAGDHGTARATRQLPLVPDPGAIRRAPASCLGLLGPHPDPRHHVLQTHWWE